MFNLPKELQEYIFSFDDTYHQVYKLLKTEFLLKMTLWRIHWLNNNIDYGNTTEQNKYNLTDFQSTRKGIEFIVEYWNKKHPSYYGLGPEQLNCEEEFITDNFEGSIHILNILKLLKKWIVKESEILRQGKKCKNFILFKPGKI